MLINSNKLSFFRGILLSILLPVFMLLIGCGGSDGSGDNTSLIPPATPNTPVTEVSDFDQNGYDANFTSSHFSGSANCATCHDNINDSKGNDVSIVKDWAATMMANAAKDPLWKAKVSSEMNRNPDLKEVIDVLRKIELGEYASLKKYKLPKDNYFVRKNTLNKLASDKKESEVILKDCEDKKDEICQKAFEVYCEYASYNEIKQQGFEIKKELFEKLMQRFEDKEDIFKFSVDDLKDLLDKYEFDKIEYIRYAKKLKTLFNPEAVLSIFETLSNEKEEALHAYLYLLFEFQMIDKAREVLLSVHSKECEKFRYILELKDCGKNFDIDIFFDL